MAPVELAVSITLAALVPISLVTFYLVKPTSAGGDIKLPETADHLEHDAFNVTTPEDIEDGQICERTLGTVIYLGTLDDDCNLSATLVSGQRFDIELTSMCR